MVDLKPGQVYVPGSDAKTARSLLNAAAKAGLNPKLAVRTTEGGFVVPEQIAPSAAKPKASRARATTPAGDSPPAPEPSPASSRGRRRKKNPQKGS